MSKNKKFTKKSSESKAPDSSKVILKEIHQKSGESRTNFYLWKEHWENKVGTYGLTFTEQWKENQSLLAFTLDEKLLVYPIDIIEDTSRSSWLPTDEEQEYLSQIEEPKQLHWEETKLYRKWVDIVKEQNRIIINRNDINTTQREQIIKESNEYKNKVNKLFSDIIDSMDREIRQQVTNYKRPYSQEEINEITDRQVMGGSVHSVKGYNTETARENLDWLFIFEVAQKICIQKVDIDEDPVAAKTRRNYEKNKLEECKHLNGSYSSWLKKWQDQWESCMAVGCGIDDTEKLMIYMACLNTDIFENVLKDWRSSLHRKNMADNFDDMVDYIRKEHNSMVVDNPSLIEKVRTKGSNFKSETSMTVKEKKNSKSKGKGVACPICGRDNHKVDDCHFRNKDYSVEQNAAYYKKIRKDKKDAKGSDAVDGTKEVINSVQEQAPSKDSGFKGTYCQPPAGKSTTFERVNSAYLEAIDEDAESTVLSNLEDTELCNATRTLPTSIDFVLDTCTESGTVSVREAAILESVKKESMLLQGVNGGTILSKESGHHALGKARVLPRVVGGKCLIAYTLIDKQYYATGEDQPGLLVLKERNNPNSKKSWKFWRDPERHNDELYHMYLEGDDINKFIASYTGQSIESVNSLYQPDRPPELNQLDAATLSTINLVNDVHLKLNHTSAQGLTRIINSEESSTNPLKSTIGLTKSGVNLWHQYLGKFCVGCVRGKMKEHDRISSTKTETYKLGEACTADLMFIDQLRGVKSPFYVCVDIYSRIIFGVTLSSKNEFELMRAVEYTKGTYQRYGHQLKAIIFDRESAIVSQSQEIQALGLEVICKAAGQKSGLVEVSISLIRGHARATKCGVEANYNYTPLIQWNNDLVLDTIGVLNRQVKVDTSLSPYELFTGQRTDYLRDFRIHWGEIVLVKKPKGIASDLKETARWGVCIRRFMNATGVIKFYMIDTKRYIYALKFQRVRVPKRVIDELNSTNINSNTISIEDDTLNPDDLEILSYSGKNAVEVGGAIPPTDVEEDALGNLEKDETGEEVGSDEMREIYQQEYLVEPEPLDDEADDLIDPEVYDDIVEAKAPIRHRSIIPEAPWIDMTPANEKRVSKPPNRLVFSSTQLLYREAKRNKPIAATAALDKELDVVKLKKVWKGLWEADLTPEQRKLILPSMISYVEKYLPSGEFDKSKVRALLRGDKQKIVGETAGPVCRVESVFLLFAIAALLDLEVFKIDFVAAFLNTDMPTDVKHKWMLLDRDISSRLVEREPEVWKKFLRADGKILVENLKLMYGYKEAAHYWNKILFEMFVRGGWTVLKKDCCALTKRFNNDFAMIVVTVDDCATAMTRNSLMKQELFDLCRTTFEGITIDEGDSISVIGMQFDFERDNKAVRVSQRRFAEKSVATFNVTKKSVTPSTEDLLEDDEDSPLLEDQIYFMSVNSTGMYGSKRTYPEALPANVYLATKYWKATESDLKKSLRVIEYFNYSSDHYLYIRPKSLKIVAYADASYGEHMDGKSHTGGCVGFEGHGDAMCNIMFICGKQPVVAKASSEAELIAANTVGDHAVWLQDMLTELGLNSGDPIEMYQDNKSTIHIAEHGGGNWKRSKHIKVRFYWITALIDTGLMILKWVSTHEMVADLLTKPLIGTKFRAFASKILGWN